MSWPGWEDFTPPSTSDPLRPSKRSKYGAVKTEVDGIAFDSKREANRYRHLLSLRSAGDIRKLRLQPRYALCPLVIEHGDVRDINRGTSSIRRVPVAEYVADFEYEESQSGLAAWRLVVEDVKGARTDIYKLKKRWFQTQYGIEIREV